MKRDLNMLQKEVLKISIKNLNKKTIFMGSKNQIIQNFMNTILDKFVINQDNHWKSFIYQDLFYKNMRKLIRNQIQQLVFNILTE